MQVSPPFSFIRFTSVYDPVNFLFIRTFFCVDFFVLRHHGFIHRGWARSTHWFSGLIRLVPLFGKQFSFHYYYNYWLT